MALATRCPACNTIFRISTAQAAAKGGMVRCGQCRNVFNSLDALVRVEDLEVIDEVSVALAPEEAAAPVDDLAAPPDTNDESPVEDASAADRLVVGEWWLPERHEGLVDPQPIVAEPASLPASSLRDDAGQLLSGRRTDLRRGDIGLDGTSPTFMRPDAAAPPRRRAIRWIVGALTLVAAVALLAQGAYFWRDELAVRWSPARPWLAAACVPLRCAVGYPRHIDSITIESATIQASGPNLNVYVLSALLRNRDAVDLRYPQLELVLTDLQDRPVLRRTLRPEDYLPPSRDGGRGGFPAESELPIRILFELNELRFAGYRLDRYYP